MNAMNEQTRAAVEEVRQTNCEFLTVPQVAKILKVNKNMVYDLISVKLLRAVKLGSTKVATIAVEDFIRDVFFVGKVWARFNWNMLSSQYGRIVA